MTEYKTFKDLKFKPHPRVPGIQAVLFFPNGHGVSVVQGPMFYIDNDREWEVAILKGNHEDWEIADDTPITRSVLGHLSEEKVTEIMRQVQDLKKVEE